jgi:hypothetical protein
VPNDFSQIGQIVREGASPRFREVHARARLFPDEVLFDFHLTGLLERGDVRTKIAVGGPDNDF